MSTQRIVYQIAGGGVAIITPSAEVDAKVGIEASAQKDVPQGCRYRIIDASDLPTDDTFRDAWEVDAQILTHGVGAESSEFPPELLEKLNEVTP